MNFISFIPYFLGGNSSLACPLVLCGDKDLVPLVNTRRNLGTSMGLWCYSQNVLNVVQAAACHRCPNLCFEKSVHYLKASKSKAFSTWNGRMIAQ